MDSEENSRIREEIILRRVSVRILKEISRRHNKKFIHLRAIKNYEHNKRKSTVDTKNQFRETIPLVYLFFIKRKF
jgi:hypothetical protein